jgi:uncharacterized protein (DUF2141 family)
MIPRGVLVALGCLVASAWTAQAPTASLAGIVVAGGESGQALRRAEVSVSSAEDSVRISAITDDQGRFAFSNLPAGRYTVSASKPAYLTSAYGARRPGRPGTPMAADAARVRLAAGDVADGLDFSIELVPAATLEVSVLTASGSPAESPSLGISVIGPPMPIFSSLQFVGQREPNQNDRFTFPNITPGRYVLLARQGAAWAMTDLVVRGSDVPAVTLTLQPPMSFTGHVVFDATTSSPPSNLAAVRVGLTRVRPSEPSSGVAAGFRIGDLPSPKPVTAQADGSFEIAGILPGRFTMSGEVPGGVWWLKSAVVDGRDLLDAPLEFGTTLRAVSGAVLTFSDRRTELTGRLQTAAGQPAPEYVVILFSSDRAHWYPGARRTRAVRPATDGEFSIGNLPAGSYRIAALTDVEPGEWQQASFLEQIVAGSLPVAIRDGARGRHDLQITR